MKYIKNELEVKLTDLVSNYFDKAYIRVEQDQEETNLVVNNLIISINEYDDSPAMLRYVLDGTGEPEDLKAFKLNKISSLLLILTNVAQWYATN